ncbi:hypothetical protein [Candidatus Nitrosocosmicus sp. SS]|nr:hypothetical protein [Candidatus Nitrosocosmicus sp. SS]
MQRFGFNSLPLNEQLVHRSFVSDVTSTPILPDQQEVSVTEQVTYLLK